MKPNTNNMNLLKPLLDRMNIKEEEKEIKKERKHVYALRAPNSPNGCGIRRVNGYLCLCDSDGKIFNVQGKLTIQDDVGELCTASIEVYINRDNIDLNNIEITE